MEDLDGLFAVLEKAGAERYGQEAVSQLEHALQCAQLAEQAGAPSASVMAALFHDVGHLTHDLGENASLRGIDDRHEFSGAAILARWFGPDVSEPVRLHVEAKRWLCHAEQPYFSTLSPASVRSLELQGGIFGDTDAEAFIAQPYARAAVAVRRWDDLAKVAGLATPPLAHYRELAERFRRTG
jgi:phosphonate degradation associated HDIG domain protein